MIWWIRVSTRATTEYVLRHGPSGNTPRERADATLFRAELSSLNLNLLDLVVHVSLTPTAQAIAWDHRSDPILNFTIDSVIIVAIS